MQRMPLEFDRTKQQLRWSNGTRLSIPGSWVDKGTWPAGSTWAKNPIPRIDWGSGGTSTSGGNCRGHGRGANCINFQVSDLSANTVVQIDTRFLISNHQSPCNDTWADIHRTDNVGSDPDDVQGKCAGSWTDGTIVDEVLIPEGLAPGMYVVGWRWDCEETTQIWSSCADVLITA